MNETIELMKKHASVRKYKKEPVSKSVVKELILAAQGAASSNFVQAYSIIYISDEAVKEQLAVLTNNPHVNSCGAFLVCCADMKRLEYACQKHGMEIKHDTTENFIVTVVDTALFAQNLALAAESYGYGICYIGGIRNNPDEVSELLRLPDKVVPLFGLAIGIPDEAQQVKPRLPVDAVFHENTYDEDKYYGILEEYDEIIREYYKGRLTNQKDTTWTKSMSTFLSEERRTFMKDFLASKGFTLK
jgi:FMN reductase (NADPH)